MTDKHLINQLLKDFEILKKKNIQLRSRITKLEAKLSKYENPKTVEIVVFPHLKTLLEKPRAYDSVNTKLKTP